VTPHSGPQGAAPRFFAPEPFAAHATVTVGEDAARHMRVLRLGPGSAVLLLDGQGSRATGTLRTLAKRSATIEVERIDAIPAAPAVHALVPIADRDRMLWLAEKAAELEAASWRPVMWKRSRSVSPKGEGSVFQGRVLARMTSALEQSGNAWLPATYPDATPEHALAALPPSRRLVLDAAGESIVRALARPGAAPLVVAVGPEGGFEDAEMSLLLDAGFERVSLGSMTLRFETAGIAALAHARAALAATEKPE
jgi:16S rRNA (uracil1498-N3)-methyltransferase